MLIGFVAHDCFTALHYDRFTTLMKGKNRMEAVQTFILLLFLAQINRVKLWQNEETEELYIVLGNLNIGKEQKAIN